MRPDGPDWCPQRSWENQHSWQGPADDDELEPIELGKLRRALWFDVEYLGHNQFVVSSPNAARAYQRRLVSFHPRTPLGVPPCDCRDRRRGELCVHILAVFLFVGDRECLRALRRLVPVVEER